MKELINRNGKFRVALVLGLSLFLMGCGEKKAEVKSDTNPPVVDNGGSGGNPNITTGVHLYTSLCGLNGGCPSDEHPYRVILNVEFQRPNGWIKVAEVDMGILGEVILGTDTPGVYRFSAKNPQPLDVIPATGPTKSVTIVTGTVSDLTIQFDEI